MNNNHRLTLLSFLAYFVMSGMLAPIGIVAAPMAEFFDVSVTTVVAQFSWLTFGILVGAILALFVFDWLRLKSLMLLLYVAILASILSLNVAGSLVSVGLALGVTGVSCGIGLAGAALIISNIYTREQRASMLVITDSSFSIAGFVCAALATWLVARGLHWAMPYQFVAVFVGLILAIGSVSSFPDRQDQAATDEPSETWPLSVWLCMVSLFLYTLGQYAMLFWLPGFVESGLGATPEQGGRLVSLFWLGMFLAQLFVAWWVLRIGVSRLVRIASIAVTIWSAPLWFFTQVDALPYLAFLWGLANFGLLKVVLSFATQQVQVPTPRLVSSLLLAATLGTAVSPGVTSWIVASTDNHTVLMFSTGCYFILTVLLLVATHKQPQQGKQTI